MPPGQPAIAGRSDRTTANDIKPAARWMRAAMVREFIARSRLKARNRPIRRRIKRKRKRKAALAMSAAVMSMSTGAISAGPSEHSIVSPVNTRMHSDLLTSSRALMEAIAEEEGVHLTVYADPIGLPTVGVGHLVTRSDGLSLGDTISYERALDLLEQDLAQAEDAVRRLVGNTPLYQHEFDALVDLVFNVGEGNAGEDGSPGLSRAIALRDYAAMADELAYHHAGDTVLDGLEYRSDRRRAMFELADYSDPRPDEIALAEPEIA